MDSLTQAVLGASVTVAVMGRRTSFAKAALVGAVAGTVPDLDVLIDHGDDLLNMVRHRAESHALFFLTLAAPLFGWLTHQLVDRKAPAGAPNLTARWSLAWLLALLTHVGIDAMTSYGTQFLQPFTDHAFAVGSVFIIDPLYTLPLLLGLLWSGLRARRGVDWRGPNRCALVFSCCYLLWSVGAQHQVRSVAQQALAEQGVPDAQLFVYATPFNTVLWRVLAITPTHSYEGFYSLLDQGHHIPLTATQRGQEYLQRWASVPAVQAMQRFTQGPIRMELRDGRVLLTDLRMGHEPHYSFVFDLGTPAQLDAGQTQPHKVSAVLSSGLDLAGLVDRMLGRDLRAPAATAHP
jgi:inner membrane protein